MLVKVILKDSYYIQVDDTEVLRTRRNYNIECLWQNHQIVRDCIRLSIAAVRLCMASREVLSLSASPPDFYY